jgi:hypothetical protein
MKWGLWDYFVVCLRIRLCLNISLFLSIYIGIPLPPIYIYLGFWSYEDYEITCVYSFQFLLEGLWDRLAVYLHVSFINFVLYSVRAISKKSRWSALPKTACYFKGNGNSLHRTHSFVYCRPYELPQDCIRDITRSLRVCAIAWILYIRH